MRMACLYLFFMLLLVSGPLCAMKQPENQRNNQERAVCFLFWWMYERYSFYRKIDKQWEKYYEKNRERDEYGRSKIVLKKRDISDPEALVEDLPDTMSFFDAKWIALALDRTDLATKIETNEDHTRRLIKQTARKFNMNVKDLRKLLLDQDVGGVLESSIKHLLTRSFYEKSQGKALFYLDQVPEFRDRLSDMFDDQKKYKSCVDSLKNYRSWTCRPILYKGEDDGWIRYIKESHKKWYVPAGTINFKRFVKNWREKRRNKNVVLPAKKKRKRLISLEM